MSRQTRTFGPGPDTLCRDGSPVCPVVVADTTRARRRGLLGSDAVVGALWLTRCPSVHMVGMRYAIDVAVVDRDGLVLTVATLQPWWGVTGFRRTASATIESAAGSLQGWGIVVGSTLTVKRV